MPCINERQLMQIDIDLFHHMVNLDYMDDYINDIKYRALQGRLPPEDMRVVERYKEFRVGKHKSDKIGFKKLMRSLTG